MKKKWGKKLLLSSLPITLRKCHTSALVTFDRGLNLTSDAGPPEEPSNTGSTCTTGTACLVPGDWSFRCPVIQAVSVLSCLRKGLTLRTRQHSVWPSS